MDRHELYSLTQTPIPLEAGGKTYRAGWRYTAACICGWTSDDHPERFTALEEHRRHRTHGTAAVSPTPGGGGLLRGDPPAPRAPFSRTETSSTGGAPGRVGPLDHRDAEKLHALVREWDRVAPGPIGGDPVRAAGEALCVAVSNLRDELERRAEEFRFRHFAGPDAPGLEIALCPGDWVSIPGAVRLWVEEGGAVGVRSGPAAHATFHPRQAPAADENRIGKPISGGDA